MFQELTIKIKLNTNHLRNQLLEDTSHCYIHTINSLVHEMVVEYQAFQKISSKDVTSPLNSSVKNQAIQDAKSIFRKVKKAKFEWIPFLRKPVIVWNNQNWSYDEHSIAMPFIVNGKSKRISFPASFGERELMLIRSARKLGTLRITKKHTKWIAQITILVETQAPSTSKTMGVDLGVKVPAVCYTDENQVKFCGNGRKNKYFRRYHNHRRKKLGIAKKPKAIVKSRDKEQRYMNDQDHKVSKEIIKFAIQKNVGIIKLEELSGIRQSTRTSRKNNHSLHTWSFYRLAKYIEYKASLFGIEVQYVKPHYTSQTCPKCTKRNHARDRIYSCSCGFNGHRDLVGARNILFAPESNGNSLAA